MRRVFAAGLLGVGLVVALPTPAQAQEQVRSFTADATVTAEGDLVVEETIVWDFAGLADKHGIFRYVPYRHRWTRDRLPTWKEGEKYDRITPVAFLRVSSATGASAETDLSRKDGNEVLRIGSADRTVSGAQTYALQYRIERAVVDDTLRYAITGLGWTVPMQAVTARITAPVMPGTTPQCLVDDVADPSCSVKVVDGVVEVVAADRADEVVIVLDPARVSSPVPVFEKAPAAPDPFSTAWPRPLLSGISTAVVGALLWVIGRRGRDRVYAAGGPIGASGDAERPRTLGEKVAAPVEFSPPEDVPPGMIRPIRAGSADNVSLTSTLVDLAVRGYLRIEAAADAQNPKKTDYLLHATPPTWTPGGPTGGSATRLRAPLRPYETRLLQTFFPGRPVVSLKELKADRTLYKPLADIKTGLLDEAVKDGYWAGRPDHATAKWAVLGVFVALAAVGLTVVAAGQNLAIVTLPLVVFGLGIVVLSPKMPVRTAKGSRLKARLDGFERLFDAGEGERVAITERAEVFSEYLPYAMAFGNVKAWVKRFADVGMAPDTGSWLIVPYAMSGMGFDSNSFSAAIDGFESSLNKSMDAAAAAPSSSGGDGGGGSSSGGGGGGSW